MNIENELDDLFEFEMTTERKEFSPKTRTCKDKVIEKIMIIKGTVLDDLYRLEKRIFSTQKRQLSRQTLPDFYGVLSY